MNFNLITKKMKNLLTLSLLAVAMLFVVACGDDNNFAIPTVTTPSAATVQVSTEVTVDFPYTAEAGFASSSVTATLLMELLVQRPEQLPLLLLPELQLEQDQLFLLLLTLKAFLLYQPLCLQ